MTLVREEADEESWACVAIAPGYEAFVADAPGAPGASAGAALPAQLLDAAARYLAAASGAPRRGGGGGLAQSAGGGGTPAAVTLVTVDLPVARRPITARRAADDAVSRAFGRAKCGTHSPSATRPGPLADALRAGFAAEAFPLATTDTTPGTPRHLVEVYPHSRCSRARSAYRTRPPRRGRTGRTSRSRSGRDASPRSTPASARP